MPRSERTRIPYRKDGIQVVVFDYTGDFSFPFSSNYPSCQRSDAYESTGPLVHLNLLNQFASFLGGNGGEFHLENIIAIYGQNRL